MRYFQHHQYIKQKPSVLRLSGFYVSTLLLSGVLMLSGCDTSTQNPMMQTIPTDSERWQDKLEGTLSQLPEEEKQLLSRYMLRMKLSQAYEKGAMPRITIAKAIEQQRKYEQMHPNNPTGKRSPVTSSKQANLYPITLMPAQTSENDSLNNVELSFVLSNGDISPITSFKGTLMMRYPAFKKAKPVVISLTHFDPPIAPKSARKLVVDVPISDINVMKAIQKPQNIDITISKGQLTLEDGRILIFE